jgi:uncharacterized protein with HEPN domain
VSRELEHRIDDIIRCCEKILRYTSGMNQEQLAEQEIVLDAVLRNIEIIGEAVKHLPDDVRARMTSIEWKKIAGMRDWLSHVYYRVDVVRHGCNSIRQGQNRVIDCVCRARSAAPCRRADG